jgi:hypothetical protein
MRPSDAKVSAHELSSMPPAGAAAKLRLNWSADNGSVALVIEKVTGHVWL